MRRVLDTESASTALLGRPNLIHGRASSGDARSSGLRKLAPIPRPKRYITAAFDGPQVKRTPAQWVAAPFTAAFRPPGQPGPDPWNGASVCVYCVTPGKIRAALANVRSRCTCLEIRKIRRDGQGGRSVLRLKEDSLVTLSFSVFPACDLRVVWKRLAHAHLRRVSSAQCPRLRTSRTDNVCARPPVLAELRESFRTAVVVRERKSKTRPVGGWPIAPFLR
ncbi:hypothetical protein HPB51_023431 [Rhipicephalus microplus]|uniref:Uncharacterized protein n=1 Tax=Rhipicephalus microplus TaxID=6941 RepID=A0A9J6DCM5_RHIMP|nr:hypothetical protein HPB51_023431 [Rhipicephalus microplus]